MGMVRLHTPRCQHLAAWFKQGLIGAKGKSRIQIALQSLPWLGAMLGPAWFWPNGEVAVRARGDPNGQNIRSDRIFCISLVSIEMIRVKASVGRPSDGSYCRSIESTELSYPVYLNWQV